MKYAPKLTVIDFQNNMTLIEDEDFTLEELDIHDDDQILMEIRNKDLTWPEEIGSLSVNLAEKSKQSEQ